jgi:hypothetical protein
MSAGMSEKDAGRRKNIAAADMTETAVAEMITVAVTADTEKASSGVIRQSSRGHCGCSREGEPYAAKGFR